MRGRDVPDLIKAHGVERALVMMAEDLYGKQTQIKQALIELSKQQDQIVGMVNTMMTVAENMKNETDRMRRIFDDGPTSTN